VLLNDIVVVSEVLQEVSEKLTIADLDLVLLHPVKELLLVVTTGVVVDGSSAGKGKSDSSSARHFN